MQIGYAPYRVRQLLAEIDWAYENPERFTICVGCGVEVTLRECLHFRAGVNTFICRNCYNFNETVKQRARGNSHQRRLKRATPKGVDHRALEEFYIWAQIRTIETRVPHHVDHIIPLLGCDEHGNHIVSGLNVPWNLQVIPASENLKKGNRVDPQLVGRIQPAPGVHPNTEQAQESYAKAARQHQARTDRYNGAPPLQNATPRLVKARR